MKNNRGFEKISIKQFLRDFEGKVDNLLDAYNSFTLPVRKTSGSAGYDIHTLFGFTLMPGESIIVPTGLKVYMNNGEFLSIVNRSSLGIKHGIMLKNQIGIIDQDYYNNISNEGHFMIGLVNMGTEIWKCNKGDAIAQGIFMNYLVVDNDLPNQEKRLGGIGSTDIKKNIKIEKAELVDASVLLKIQKKVFNKYTIKYGDFERNPAHMSLKRMQFNLKYQFGQYYKILDDNKIIGGLFAFKYEEEDTMQIGQFYIDEDYHGQGIGTLMLDFLFATNPEIKTWYVDTIYEEKYNMSFYQKYGFEIIDDSGFDPFEEAKTGLTFVILKKTVK